MSVAAGKGNSGEPPGGASTPRSDPATAETLTAPFWKTRRAAALSGIIAGLLLETVMILMRVAVSSRGFEQLKADEHHRALIRIGLSIVPFAGIAFLWFIGVVREQLGEVEDRLFSTVFLGSGLLFVVLMFAGAVTASSMLSMLEGAQPDAAVWAFGRDNAQGLIAFYAMRMAAVFMLSVSTLALRLSSIARPVCYAGYAVALALLLAPAGQNWVQLLFPGWVLVVGAVLLRPRPHPVPDVRDGP